MPVDGKPGGRWAVLAVACGLAGGAAADAADDEAPPDPAMLEYLGSWDESDAEWLLVADDATAEDDERGDDADKDEASQERDDEN